MVPLFKYLNQNSLLPKPGTLIFELGCNDGRVLTPFYKNGYRVGGVDMQPDKIELAKTAMPIGDFQVGDIRTFTVPAGSFVIMRNVLPFLSSKQEVDELLNRHSGYAMFFTFFGKDDELAKTKLFWSHDEVLAICDRLGARIVDEFNGDGQNMAGQYRRSHIFSCLRL